MRTRYDKKCPKCGDTFHGIKYLKETNEVHLTCGDCGYEWNVPALDEKVLTEEKAEKIISQSDFAEMKATTSERMVEKIVGVLISRIEALTEDDG